MWQCCIQYTIYSGEYRTLYFLFIDHLPLSSWLRIFVHNICNPLETKVTFCSYVIDYPLFGPPWLTPIPPPHPHTMGHFRESSIKENQQQSHYTPASAKKLRNFCLIYTKGDVSLLLEGLESSFGGQIGLELNFQFTGAHKRCGGRIRVAN